MGHNALSKQWSRLLGDTAQGGGQGVRLAAWRVDAADTERVSQVWLRAQTEAGLPAPAISVDGASGWQLWFALAQPRPQAEVERVLRCLISGWLNEPGAEAPLSFACWPAEHEAAAGADAAWPPVPKQVAADRWSAFVSPDLVPVFAESPWLDCAPGEEGQAALLGKLQPIATADWVRLVASQASDKAPVERQESGLGRQGGEAVAGDPRSFLLSVMNDAGVDMALRIEAARVLLAHG